MARRHDAARFVKQNRAPGRLRPPLAVDGNPRALGNDEARGILDDAAVDANAARTDRAGRLRARQNSELRQRAVEWDLHREILAVRHAICGILL